LIERFLAKEEATSLSLVTRTIILIILKEAQIGLFYFHRT
jgi:hypothetical protein